MMYLSLHVCLYIYMSIYHIATNLHCTVHLYIPRSVSAKLQICVSKDLYGISI